MLGVGLLIAMVLWLHRARLGTSARSSITSGSELGSSGGDTEAVDVHVVTVLSSGPGLVTAGGMASEGGREVHLWSQPWGGGSSVWSVLQSSPLLGRLGSGN